MKNYLAFVLKVLVSRIFPISGTRTHSRKDAAKTKIDKYLATLGSIMTD